MGILVQSLAGRVTYPLFSQWDSKSKIHLGHLTKRDTVFNLTLRNLDGDQESVFLRNFPGGSKSKAFVGCFKKLFYRQWSWIKKIIGKFCTGLIYKNLKQQSRQLLICDNCRSLLTLKEAGVVNCVSLLSGESFWNEGLSSLPFLGHFQSLIPEDEVTVHALLFKRVRYR